jgi:3-oxoacyl-[acyl-carrier protein] reductase
MDLGIAGRHALVCGASRGLGFACAEALAREGASVTLVSRTRDSLEVAAARIREATGASVSTVAADVASVSGRGELLTACPAPDILVTNAGGPPSADFRTLTLADWSSALEGNFLSAVELIRLTVDGMAARKFGRIVNITSLTVRSPVEKLDLSNAPRLALTGFVAGVARQLAPSGVTINNLLPGAVATERLNELGETADKLIARVPMGRAGTPAEFGATCAFLCSAHAAYITAQNILVDGGLCVFTV